MLYDTTELDKQKLSNLLSSDMKVRDLIFITIKNIHLFPTHLQMQHILSILQYALDLNQNCQKLQTLPIKSNLASQRNM